MLHRRVCEWLAEVLKRSPGKNSYEQGLIVSSLERGFTKFTREAYEEIIRQLYLEFSGETMKNDRKIILGKSVLGTLFPGTRFYEWRAERVYEELELLGYRYTDGFWQSDEEGAI